MEPNQVFSILRERITNLELPPGSILNLSELAQDFGMTGLTQDFSATVRNQREKIASTFLIKTPVAHKTTSLLLLSFNVGLRAVALIGPTPSH